jgi:hypothetical protein
LAASNRFSGLISRCAIPFSWRNDWAFSIVPDLINSGGDMYSRHQRPFGRNRISPIPPVHPHQVLSILAPSFRLPTPNSQADDYSVLQKLTNLIEQIPTDRKLQ